MPASSVLVAACLLAAPITPACAQSAPAGEPVPVEDLAALYGFSGLHVSKFNDGLTGLVAADLDGDGKGDLAVVNNSKAKIELLLQRRGDAAAAEGEESDKVNALPDETWFRRDSFPTEEKVGSLCVADVDGDGRADLVFTGDSGRLTIAFRDDQGAYSRVQRLRLEETGSGPGLVRCGDLDGDGRRDVAVLSEQNTWLYLQREDGSLAEAFALPNASRDADDLRIADLDGDGHGDLIYVLMESEWPLRWRLGAGDGAFGPQVTSRFTPIRSLAVADVDADGRSEIAAVRRRSGRLTLLRHGIADEGAVGSLTLSAVRVVPFSPLKDAARRQILVVDLDSDGRPDVLATEPSAARVVLHRGGAGYVASNYPSFLGAAHPGAVDLDGDGRLEVVVSSAEENAVGVADVGEGGRVDFPRALALPDGGEVVALQTVPGPDAAVWLVVADGKGRSRSHRLLALDAAGDLSASHDLPELKTDPTELMLVDLDRNGTRDALVFVPTELPRILLMQDGGEPRHLQAESLPGLGLLDGVDRRAVFHGDVDGDGALELLVPGGNFVRAFHLDADGVPQVVTQVNLPDPGSQAASAAAADLDGDGVPEALVVERSSNTLQVHAREGEGWTLVARVDLGDLRPRGMSVQDLDADGRVDILLEGTDAFGCVLNGARTAGLSAALDFETPVEDAYLDQLALGDVNGDGLTDVVMTDSMGHRLAIAAVTDQAIQHVLRFPVFEVRLFESGRGGREPREVLVADVTGDQRDDIALVVHDRVIIYPQERAP
ncbi:MAG: FG-GAP-like repeat-containing protein [Planctomycetota bacterium]|jgi:hypothetical protein